eukprot:SAG22_NODE_947_length_6367_cov_23.437460_6_plen_215_part_00
MPPAPSHPPSHNTGLLGDFGPLGQQGAWAHISQGTNTKPKPGAGEAEAEAAPHLGASNNWAVDGRFTASGKPLLANDPHLTMTAPAVWLLVHLECTGKPSSGSGSSYNAIGAALAGTPFVVIGRNPQVGWGVTNSGVDVQDLYVITEAAAGGAGGAGGQQATSYMLDGQTKPFVRRQESIKVAGQGPVLWSVRETVFGPVRTDRAVCVWCLRTD